MSGGSTSKDYSNGILTKNADLTIKSGADVKSAITVEDRTSNYYQNCYVMIFTGKVYAITDGDNQTPIVGTDRTLTFTSEGEFYKFITRE